MEVIWEVIVTKKFVIGSFISINDIYAWVIKLLCYNAWYCVDIFALRSMQVNVDTWLGGVNSYKNYINRLFHNKYSPKGRSVLMMVFRCVSYDNCAQIRGAIVIYICAGQFWTMETHVPEVVIDMKIINIEFFVIKFH